MIKKIKKDVLEGFLQDFNRRPKFWYKKQINGDFEFDQEAQLAIIDSQKFTPYLEDPNIKYIKNPTEETKRASCKKCARSIECIENPSDELKEMVIRNNPDDIRYVENPNQDLCLFAINESRGYAIFHIKNPTPQMQMLAYKYRADAFRFIENPSEELCLEAVIKNGMNLQYIKNPTEEMKMIAVKQDPIMIQQVKNPSKELLEAAVKANPYGIKFIKDPDNELITLSIKEYPKNIQYVKKENQTAEMIDAYFEGEDNHKFYYANKISKKYINLERGYILVNEDPSNIKFLPKKVQRQILDTRPELIKFISVTDEFLE